jgi:hypothetical protein
MVGVTVWMVYVTENRGLYQPALSYTRAYTVSETVTERQYGSGLA